MPDAVVDQHGFGRGAVELPLLRGLEVIQGAEGIDTTLLYPPELLVEVIETIGGLTPGPGLEALLLNAEEVTRHPGFASLELLAAR